MKDNNKEKQKKSKMKSFDSIDYNQLSYEDRISRLLSKTNGCIDGDVTIIDKLGIGGMGTVYKVKASVSGKIIELAHKVFYTGKEQKRIDDDYDELYINWQITNYISENIDKIAKDPFLCECIEKVPILITTKDQKSILSDEKTPEDQYIAAQKASELQEGIFFEIKGNQNLEDLINSGLSKMSFEDKKKILLDILMAGTILDRACIIQRDFNCENIQISNQSDNVYPQAYLVDFGKAIHKGIIHIFNDDESKKRDYCAPFFYSAPPEAYDDDDESIFGDKYNAFNIGLVMFPLFFDKEGQDLMYNFKWSNDEDIVHHRKHLFEDIEEIIEMLNSKLENPYTKKQIAMIKSIITKLINPDADKRLNSESVAREIYKEETEKGRDIIKDNLSFSDTQKCNNSRKHINEFA